MSILQMDELISRFDDINRDKLKAATWLKHKKP